MSIPWAEIATALAFFGANVLSPGPNVFNTIAIALGSGRRAALAVVPAVALGVLVWASAAVLGAAVLFRQFPAAKTALTALGGALLIWFASRYLHRAWNWSLQVGKNRVVTPRQAFAITLGILATNPKALTTWLVLISIFPAGRAGAVGITAMILGAVVVAALGHLAYALAFSTRRAAQAYARMGRWINAGVGCFFLSLGVTLLLRVAGLLA
ncbi:MAG TPA: LysE family transporter [Thermohalobaculum sp.]|nr:LysE family transporter [Thermohalobaculum sp.]